jgi:hypothetical protein
VRATGQKSRKNADTQLMGRAPRTLRYAWPLADGSAVPADSRPVMHHRPIGPSKPTTLTAPLGIVGCGSLVEPVARRKLTTLCTVRDVVLEIALQKSKATFGRDFRPTFRNQATTSQTLGSLSSEIGVAGALARHALETRGRRAGLNATRPGRSLRCALTTHDSERRRGPAAATTRRGRSCAWPARARSRRRARVARLDQHMRLVSLRQKSASYLANFSPTFRNRASSTRSPISIAPSLTVYKSRPRHQRGGAVTPTDSPPLPERLPDQRQQVLNSPLPESMPSNHLPMSQRERVPRTIPLMRSSDSCEAEPVGSRVCFARPEARCEGGCSRLPRELKRRISSRPSTDRCLSRDARGLATEVARRCRV